MIYVPRTVTLLPLLWTFALLSLLPTLGWLLREPKRRRFVFALILALALSIGTASALGWDPPAWCCQDLVAYGLCWLPWWC